MRQQKQSTQRFLSLMVCILLTFMSCQTPIPTNLAPKEQEIDNFKIQSNSPLPTFKQNELPKTPRYVVKFISKDASLDDEVDLPDSGKVLAKGKILMPKQGQFNVNFSTGTAFQITDNDATDGTAAVQMPQGQLDVFLRLKGQPSEQGKQREITFEDVTAGINETLKRTKKDKSEEKFYGLGSRSFTSSTSFTWKLTNDKVKNMTTRWYTSDTPNPSPTPTATPTPPPSNEVTVSIGTNGGLVELPGVGSLTIPAGSLSQTTAITMRKVDAFPEELKEVTTVSPIVQLEPNGLTFNTPVTIKLETNTSLVGTNHPSLVQFVSTSSTGVEILMKDTPINQSTLNDGALLSHFSFVTKTIPAIVSDEQLDKYCLTQLSFVNHTALGLWDFDPAQADIELDNLCNQLTAPNDGHFVIYYSSTLNPPSNDKVIGAVLAAEKGYNHYETLAGGELPRKWHAAGVSDPKIPIFMVSPAKVIGSPSTAVGLTVFMISQTATPPYNFIATKNNYLHPVNEDNIYHEVFHLFQLVNISSEKADDLFSLIRHPNPAIAFESTATYMAARRISADWDELNYSTSNPTTQNKQTALWLNTPYSHLTALPEPPGNLQKNIQKYLGGSVYGIDTNQLIAVRYEHAGLMAYLANTMGDEILLTYPKTYANQSPIKDPMVTLNEDVAPLMTIYPDYAIHALLQDRYGFEAPNGVDSRAQTLVNLAPIHLVPPIPSPRPPEAVVEDFANISAFNGATTAPVPLGNHQTELDGLEIRYHKLRRSTSSSSGIDPGVLVSDPDRAIVIVLDEVFKTAEGGSSIPPTVDSTLLEQVAQSARVMPTLADSTGKDIALGTYSFTLQSTRLGQKYAVKLTSFADIFVPEKYTVVVPNVSTGKMVRQAFTYNFKAYVTGRRCVFGTCEPIF